MISSKQGSVFVGTKKEADLFATKVKIISSPFFCPYSLYLECLNEGLAVADREGVGLSEDVGLRIIKKPEEYRSQGSHAKSSMLIDLENGKRTEIDALNGTLVRKAHALGVDVPINRCIVASVKMCRKWV